MTNLIDYILDLFRSESAAQAFVAAPEQAMRDAGLAGVTAAQVSAVAATAVPGLALGNGDPIVGLQRAVSNNYGFSPAYDTSFAPNYAPSPTFAPETNTEFASRNNTDFASHNDTSLLSPHQDAGANAQQGAFNLGFGDITLGDKTSANGDGAVAVGGSNSGDIVSGDGAVLGNNNEVNNGDIRADHGSNVAVGHSTVADSGTTAGGDVISTGGQGTVIKGSDNTQHTGDTSVIGGSQTTTTVGGTGNVTAADGHQTTTTTVTHTSSDDHSVVVDDHSVSDNSVHDSSDHSLFDTNVASNNDTSLASHNDTALSHNHLLGF
jgi:hypothetical protein